LVAHIQVNIDEGRMVAVRTAALLETLATRSTKLNSHLVLKEDDFDYY
jgi:hypothetical protein